MARFRTILSATFLAATLGVSYITYQDMTKDDAPTPPNPPGEVVPPPAPPTAANDCTAPYESKRGDNEVSSRMLTPGEKLLTKNLFGDLLDANTVCIRFYADNDLNFTSDVKAGETRSIEVYGRDNFSDDYSRDKNVTLFGGLVYELTHVLQNRAGNGWQHGDTQGEQYPLDSRYIFQYYGLQQQRAIMADYAQRFLHETRHTRYLPGVYANDRSDTDPFLERLVEDAFPSAQAARINFANIETRPLTPGETALISSIFGKEIDLTNVKVRLHPEEYSDIAGSVSDGGGADFWGKSQSSNDYSKADPWHMSNFVHEMTHVWQNQTNWQNTVMEAKVYRYPLEEKYKFNDFSIEQQAAMMEDYTNVFLCKGDPRWIKSVYGSGYQEKFPLLQKTVEDRFPGMKLLRQTMSPDKQSSVTQTSALRPLRAALG